MSAVRHPNLVQTAVTPPGGAPVDGAVVGRAGLGVAGLEVGMAKFRARIGGPAAVAKLLRKLTVVAKPLPGAPRHGPPPRRLAYETAGDVLRLPRRLAPALLAGKPPAVDRLDTAPAAAPAGAPARLLPPLPAGAAPPALYPYQAAAAAHLTALGGLLAPGAFPAVAYLQLDPGLGKTRVGLAVAQARLGPVCVVAPTQALAEQWLDEAGAAWPHWRAAQFARGTKRGRAVSAATHDLVVVVINTFRDLEPEFAAGFATVLLDEAHELCSPSNARALWIAQAAGGVLGLSATPRERPDGLDALVAVHLGPPLIAADIPAVAAGVGAVAWRARVRTIEYAGDPAHATTVIGTGGTASAILTIESAAADPARIRWLADEIVRLARAHELAPGDPGRAGLPPGKRHGVFVFAEHREFLHTLRDALAPRLGRDVAIADDIEAGDDGAGGAATGAAAGDAGQVPVDFPHALPAGLPDDDECDSGLDATVSSFSDMYFRTGDDAGAYVADDTGDDAADGNIGDADDAVDDAADANIGDADDAADDAADGMAADVPVPITVLRGGVAAGEVGRARVIGAHVICTTYGYSRRGISLPEMTALVLATPRRNGSTQILGRVFRRGGDPEIERVIVDLVDTRTCLKSQYADRRKVYRAKNWPIERIPVSHVDI